MRDARYTGGENLGNVNAGTGHRRCGSGGQQETAGSDAIGHAQGAVNGLSQQADSHGFPERVSGQGLGDQRPSCELVRAIEQACCQECHHTHQQENHGPHRHAHHRVARWMADVVLDRRQAQRLVFGVDDVVAQVKVADLHGAGRMRRRHNWQGRILSTVYIYEKDFFESYLFQKCI